MIPRPPRSTRTDTLLPTLRSSDLALNVEQCHLSLSLAQQRPAVGSARGHRRLRPQDRINDIPDCPGPQRRPERSEEHTSELQSLMRISYAVFCLKKKKRPNTQT